MMNQLRIYDSAALLNYVECFSLFQLIVLGYQTKTLSLLFPGTENFNLTAKKLCNGVHIFSFRFSPAVGRDQKQS